MRTVSRLFGSSSQAAGYGSTNSNILYSGTIDDETTVVLTLDPGGIYELFTYEYNASTGAYRGHHLRSIVAPVESLFGTTAVTAGNDFSSSNSGVNLNYPTDSTVTLVRASATYAVKYVLMAVGTNIENPTSAASEVEQARDQAQAYAQAASGFATAAESSATDASGYAAAASASASSAEVAASHYPKVEGGYWYIWDVNSSAWVSTGVQARGATGATPDLTIGNVITGAAGSSAAATITGTPEDPVLNLTIPRGNPGGLILANNVSVLVSAWAASQTPVSADFPYEATITILGVTGNMIPDVIFSADDAVSGNYAPVSQTGTDSVTIYAAEIPAAAITIPTIMVHEV